MMKDDSLDKILKELEQENVESIDDLIDQLLTFVNPEHTKEVCSIISNIIQISYADGVEDGLNRGSHK